MSFAGDGAGGHGAALITTIAAALGLALLLGFLASRVRIPPLVGYLLAGVLIGPGTPGFVADVELAGQLAELGVMLMMFGVGLHFSIGDLLAVRGIALPGALLQIAVATVLGAGVATAWGWPPGAGLVFGLALSVASTVVLLRALEDRGVLGSLNGRIAVGWLVVEDLVVVLILVLLPVVAGVLGGAVPPAGSAHRSAAPSRSPPSSSRRSSHSWCWWAASSSPVCSGRSPAPARGSCSRSPSSRQRWAWPTPPPSCSVCRSRSERSSRE
jgi:hypothetical protein